MFPFSRNIQVSENKNLFIEEKNTLAEKEGQANKRKGETVVTINLTDDCRLEEIAVNLTERTTNRKVCEMCKGVKKAQTRYWCLVHKSPVCILKCYDAHRTMTLIDLNDKGKFKKPKKVNW